MKRSTKSLKILFCGSFKFLDEMKKLAEELRTLGFECFVPKFALGDFPAPEIEKLKEERKRNGFKNGDFARIVKVTSWFYDRLKEADILIIFDKNGYVGLSLAAEIGAAHVLGKPTLFLEEPNDAGLKALLRFSKNFKVVSLDHLSKEIKNLRGKMKG